ncbi:MAG: C69 family dipeptidase [Clostridiales Family XIII bacterium]|nr:C69 family dipeptidase [Clostridiales Family XIII bacterium]
MKKFRTTRIIVSVVTAALLLITGTISSFACTGLYLGKDTTENGSVIWGRSEDISARYSKILTVHPVEYHEEGDMYESSTGFKWPYPERTLRYTLAKDSYFNERISPEPYAEVGINEKNVAISATVTISSAKQAITAAGNDPMVSARNGGLIETDLATVVLMNAETARGAIELIANVIDTKGAGGREAFTVSDPNEVWYMEILSGHQYVAVKAPDDKIAFSPNMTMLGSVDITDTENVIVSPGLITVAEKAGAIVKDDDGLLRIAETYANISATSLPGRLYLGYYYLKGVDAALALQPGYQEYYIDPREEKGYTLYEAMRFLAYHGNEADTVNGRYVSNPSGNGSSIGNAGTVEAHMFETRDAMPADLATVEWVTMGPAEFSLYLPYYSLTTETHESYWNADSATYNPDSFYWVFREIYSLSNANRKDAAQGVLEFFANYQKSLIAQQAAVDEEMLRIYAVDPELAQVKATELSKAVAGEAFNNAKQLLTELQAFVAKTGKRGDFVPSALENNVLPDYSFTAVGGTGLPGDGDFTITADKESKTVVVEGSDYAPNESYLLRVAYNRIPVPGDNDYEIVVKADEDGNIEAALPSEIAGDAPWLGGENYRAYIAGEVEKSETFKATYAGMGSGARVQAKVGRPLQIDPVIDGVAYVMKSSNPAIATVNYYGAVTPIRAGAAIITLQATDGSGLTSSVVVNVTP